MSYNIETIAVSELDRDLYKKLRRLNLGNSGLMKLYLDDAIDKTKQPQNPYSFRKDETALVIRDAGKVIAWALLVKSRLTSRSKYKQTIHVYVRSTHRGKGFAKRLISHAVDMTKPAKLYCRGNGPFFNKFGIRYG